MADPTTTTATICTGFKPNPAVFGLGIRLSFYFIATLAAAAPVKSTFSKQQIREIELGETEVQPRREISSVVTVQGVTGLGLLITAVIQTGIKNLSLYHAYLVINLLFLMSTSFLYFLLSPNPVVRRQWFYLSSLILLAAFTLYVGLTAETFGSQPECNETVTVIWFPRPMPASFAWFKGFGITIFVIYLTVAMIHAVQLVFFRKRTSVGSASGKAFRWHGLLVLVINVVLAGIIEATIQINDVPDVNSPTSFGQILPLVMLISPVTDVWNDNYPLLHAKFLTYRAAAAAGKGGASDRIALASYPSGSRRSRASSRPSSSGYFSVDSDGGYGKL